jgi:hypothetical protein
MKAASTHLVPDVSWFFRHLGVYFSVAALTGGLFVAGAYVYSRLY